MKHLVLLFHFGLLVVVVLSCSEPELTSIECGPMLFTAAAQADSTWQQRLLAYVETHDPAQDAYPVVRPNSGSIQKGLKNAGGRITHEFNAFSGVLVIIKVRDLPKILGIEGIYDVSMGASGDPLCPVDT